MENVILIVHLIIALFLIAVVLLQRSEGGALGIGGGGGGLVSQRGAATALSKVTWALAIAFICTSITLTVISGGGTRDDSVFSGQQGGSQGGDNALTTPLPSGSDGDVPLPTAPAQN